jgi:hypothetical protein
LLVVSTPSEISINVRSYHGLSAFAARKGQAKSHPHHKTPSPRPRSFLAPTVKSIDRQVFQDSKQSWIHYQNGAPREKAGKRGRLRRCVCRFLRTSRLARKPKAVTKQLKIIPRWMAREFDQQAPWLKQSGRPYPTRVTCRFQGASGQVVLDQIRTVDKARLVKALGRIDSRTAYRTLDILTEMFAKIIRFPSAGPARERQTRKRHPRERELAGRLKSTLDGSRRDFSLDRGAKMRFSRQLNRVCATKSGRKRPSEAPK